MKTSFMSALALVVAFAATSVFSATVFLDPVNGDDANNGLSETAPVKSFERARTQANGGLVYLMSTLSVTEDTTFDLDGGTLRRYISSDGTVTNTADLISCNTAGVTLEFSNITVEGIGTDAKIAGRLIYAGNADVILGINTLIGNSFSQNIGVGVRCNNLTMNANSMIRHCYVNSTTDGGAGAHISGILKMSDFAAICFNTNINTYGSSIAGRYPVGGAYVKTLEMSGNSSIYGNYSQARGSSDASAKGGAGVYIYGSDDSVISDNASIRDNFSYWQLCSGVYFPSSKLILADSASVVSNSVIPNSVRVQYSQALYGSTLIMSNKASVVYNGNKASSGTGEKPDGCMLVANLFMYDDSLVVSNKSRNFGGVVISAGGGMYDRSKIGFNEGLYTGYKSRNGGVLVLGGSFSLNDDCVIEGHNSGSSYIISGAGACGSGRLIVNSGTIKNNNTGVCSGFGADGGTVEINGGQIINNATCGIRLGSRVSTYTFSSNGKVEVNGGLIAYNGAAFAEYTSSLNFTGYFRGGIFADNTAASSLTRPSYKYMFSGVPCFEDPIKLLYTNVTFYIDGRMRSGAQIPIIFKTLNSKSKEIESLTDANSYGLDMKQDGSMVPQIVALPSGRITNAARYSKYFSVANEFSDPTVERYMNDAGEGRMGLSQYRYSGSSLFMVY